MVAAAVGVFLVAEPSQTFALPIMAAFALLFGFLLVMGIGGADMPTVIAILNAYTGMSAAALGFVLNNKLLIVAGSLDGSSGFVLALIMSQAMNRSFTNVLFGGVGAKVVKSAKGAAAAAGSPGPVARRPTTSPRSWRTPGRSSSSQATAWRSPRRSTPSRRSRTSCRRRASTSSTASTQSREGCRGT